VPGFDGNLTLSSSVTDLDASIAWFAEKLGFELVYRVDDMGWAELSTTIPGVTIGLGQTETVDGRGGNTPVFGVVDVDSARAELEAGGVRFDGDTVEEPGMVKLATFYDPDGNTYMLAQSL